jgi:hypothetical protein
MPDTEQVSAVAEAVGAAELSEAARQRFRAEMTSPAFVHQLSKAGLFPDALKFLAFVLGARRSVVWAAACVRALHNGGERTEERRAALAAVDEWLADATDEKRRAAKTAAEAVGVKTPEGCIAMAAFFSEGSIAPAHLQSVPPPPHVAEKLCAGGVLLGVVALPQNAAERFEQCLALGLKDVKT